MTCSGSNTSTLSVTSATSMLAVTSATSMLVAIATMSTLVLELEPFLSSWVISVGIGVDSIGEQVMST